LLAWRRADEYQIQYGHLSEATDDIAAAWEQAIALRDAALSAQTPRTVSAWMHPDGHVVPAATMDGARQDGGAMLSSLAAYTIPLIAQSQTPGEGWMPIESAPKTGRTLLLGYFNALGNWRTLRGEWFSREVIDQQWENAEDCEESWYETMVEGDEERVWKTEPTHFQYLPKPPATPGEA
jgi:hypothetical protein